MKYIILILLVIFSLPSFSASPALSVKVIKTEFSGYWEECEGCITANALNIYTVKINKVLEGNFNSKKIKVVVYEHSESKTQRHRNWHMKIEIGEFEDQKTIEDLGTKYYLKRKL